MIEGSKDTKITGNNETHCKKKNETKMQKYTDNYRLKKKGRKGHRNQRKVLQQQ